MVIYCEKQKQYKLAVKKLRKSVVEGCKNGYTVIITAWLAVYKSRQESNAVYIDERIAGKC